MTKPSAPRALSRCKCCITRCCRRCYCKFEFGPRQRKQAAQRTVKAEPAGQHIIKRAVPFNQLMMLEDRCGAAPVLAQRMPRAQYAEFARYDLPGGRRRQMIERTPTFSWELTPLCDGSL